MGSTIDQVFQAFKTSYENHQASVDKKLVVAMIHCLEVTTNPDGTVGRELKDCFDLHKAAIDDIWSHSIFISDDRPVDKMGMMSSYAVPADVGLYYKKCVQMKVFTGSFPSFAIGFCGGLKKTYVSTDDQFHGSYNDRKDLLALQAAVKAVTGLELPIVIDDAPYSYYLYGTNIKLWSFTESVDLATLK